MVEMCTDEGDTAEFGVSLQLVGDAGGGGASGGEGVTAGQGCGRCVHTGALGLQREQRTSRCPGGRCLSLMPHNWFLK